MERLTIRNSDGSVSQPTDLKWAEALELLAAYEDTGLTPEEARVLKEFCQRHTIADIDHLNDLAQAEQDGRLVVLPCCPGAELTRNGKTFKADHWNISLSAFREEPANRSGLQVAIFSTEEATAALRAGEE